MGLMQPFRMSSDVVLRTGLAITILAIALTVIAIRIQAVWREVLDNPRPWPDEQRRVVVDGPNQPQQATSASLDCASIRADQDHAAGSGDI